MKKLSTIVTLATSLVISGCALDTTDTEGESIGTAEDAVVWGNGNDPTFFWAPSTQSALVALAGAPLVTSNGELASTSLATTESGKALLSYVVGCALPSGTSVSSAQAGRTFQGAVGLVTTWATSPLSATTDRRWMTSCLLQTLNGLGVHVPIRLTGYNAALDDTSSSDAATFSVNDATMFGNIFRSSPYAYACTDVDLISACGVSTSLATLQRICGLSPTCGVTVLGPCALSCQTGAGGKTCYGLQGGVHQESISSSVQESVAVDLYPLCGF